MSDWLFPVIFVVLYYAAMRWLLPRLGVPT